MVKWIAIGRNDIYATSEYVIYLNIFILRVLLPFLHYYYSVARALILATSGPITETEFIQTSHLNFI